MLRLLSALLEDPEEDDRNTSVVPVVVDDFAGHNDLVRATAHAVGASLIVASEVADGVRGRLDHILKTRIEEYLRVPRSGGGESRVAIRADQGIVHARIDDRTELASRSEREVAGLATALFSEELQTSSLAFIVYNETVLDDEWAEAIWRLFGSVDGTRFMAVKRLILLIERSGEDTPDHHLDSEPTVRFFVRSSGLTRRKPWLVDLAEIRYIAEQAASNGLVLFLGAGFSSSSGLPLGNTLRDDALRGFLAMPEAGFGELASAFFEYLRANGRLLEVEHQMTTDEFHRRLTLERVLREEIWRSGADDSPTLRGLEEMNDIALKNRGPAVSGLHNVIRLIPRTVVITVNFDTLVEVEDGDVHTMVTEQEFRDGRDYLGTYLDEPDNPVPVLKLHGSIRSRETIIATVDQTAQGLSTEKEDCIRALLETNSKVPWVYVGYSMRDPDVWSILQSRVVADRADEYWVGPFEDPNALAWSGSHRQFGQDRRTFWERCITLTADRFFEQLSVAWTTQHD